MSFKISDMKDVGKSSSGVLPKISRTKKWYPTITLDEKQLPDLKDYQFGDKITVHAHGEITGKSKYNDDPVAVTIETQKVAVKAGHNPKAHWMNDDDLKAYDRCLKDLESKKGINKYAVCMASIKKAKQERKEKVLKRL